MKKIGHRMADKQSDWVSLKELAERLGLDRSNARKLLGKYGLTPARRRMPDTGNQVCLVITKRQALELIKLREDEGFLNSGKPVSVDVGFFYIIQLVPELEPKRLKFGFATDVSERLNQHRTAAPTAVLVKSWLCKKAWEVTIMDCLTAGGCEVIRNEVFECTDVEKVVAKGDELFSVLPDLRHVWAGDLGIASGEALTHDH